MLRRRRSRRSRSIIVEQLEDRTLLSTITVTSPEDNENADGLITLREAIVAANTNTSVDGSTAGSDTEIDAIEFADGVTQITLTLGEFELTDSVAIVGPDTRVEIDAQSASRHFNITVGNLDVRFENLSLANGYTEANGGSISVERDAATTGVTATVLNSSFENNHADGHGGAIEVFGREPDDGSMGQLVLTIVDSSFASNSTSGTGGAIVASGNMDFRATGTTFVANEAANNAGALLVSSYTDQAGTATATIHESVFDGNVARGDGSSGSGGGFYYFGTDVVSVTESTFRRNTANWGGGLRARGHSDVIGQTVITDSLFHENIAHQSGGAVVAEDLTVTDSVFTANEAESNAGAVLVTSAEEQADRVHAIVESSTFKNNVAHSSRHDAGFGGAMYYSGDGSLSINDSTFQDNKAADGGGVSAQGLTGYQISATISNSLFDGNSALHNGGGLDTYEAVITDTTFRANEAGLSGGGLYAGRAWSGEIPEGQFTLDLVRSSLIGNSADHQAIYIIGEGLLDETLVSDSIVRRYGSAVEMGSGDILNSALVHNRTTALSAGARGSVLIHNSTISENTGSGVVIERVAPSAQILNSTLSGNRVGVFLPAPFISESLVELTIDSTIMAGNSTDLAINRVKTLEMTRSILGIEFGPQLKATNGGVDEFGNRIGTRDVPVYPGIVPLGTVVDSLPVHFQLPVSFARDAGANPRDAEFDAIGNPRTQGTATDIGAIEGTMNFLTTSVEEVNEESDTVTVTVTLHGDTDPFTLDYETIHETTDADDIQPISGEASFAGTDGEEKTFTIQLMDDDELEADETFLLQLKSDSTDVVVPFSHPQVVIQNTDQTGAFVEQGTLYIGGTDNEDFIKVSRFDTGAHTLKLNGETFGFGPEFEVTTLEIRSYDGDDEIELRTASADFPLVEHNVFAGDGDDFVNLYLRPTDRADVDGGLGNDRLKGRDGNETLRGGDGDDTLEAGLGNDSLEGGAGQDTLIGRGPDSLQGGDGNDLLDGRRLESGFASGGDGDDSIIGGKQRDTLLGDAGNDTIRGGGGNDYITGGDGHDSLIGNGGNDEILGEGGHDYIDGKSGHDSLKSGAGNDTVLGGDRGDFIQTGSGHDVVDGGRGNDRIFGSKGDDTLDGGSEDDEIYGEEGDDSILGSAGRDELAGNDGDDMITGGPGHDTIAGGLGLDTLSGDDGNDRLLGGLDDDQLSGGSGRDLLVGGIGADTLFGGADDDLLVASSVDAGLLTKVEKEWQSDRDYLQRVRNIRGGSAKSEDRLNGRKYLRGRSYNQPTVVDDAAADNLQGEEGLDFFFALISGDSLDLVDRIADERVDQI